MKINKIILLAIILTLPFIISCQQHKAQNELIKSTKSLQESLPFDAGGIAHITKLRYEHNTIIATIEYNDDNRLRLIRLNDENTLKSRILNGMFANSSTKKALECVVDAKASVSFEIGGINHKILQTIRIESNELKTYFNQKDSKDMQLDFLNVIKTQIDSARPNLPLKISDEVELTDAYVIDRTVVYQYKFINMRNAQIEPSDTLSTRKEMLGELRKNLSVYKLEKDPNMKFVYIYYDADGNNLYTIKINSSEI